MNKIVREYSWSIVILSILLIVVVGFNIRQKQLDKTRSQNQLIKVHERAVENFENTMREFAAIVSGMRSFMNLSETLPTDVQFQQFVRNQMSDLGQKDSIVVSFIDTAHTFVYSFTPNKLNPHKLVGRSVQTLRNREEIKRLNNLMIVDGLILFKPINLVEGWVGLPMNFRVVRDDVVLGYVAPIINFRTIMQPVYEDELADGYAFRFESAEGFDFDREAIFDGSQIHNARVDEDNFKTLGLLKSDFHHTTIQLFGNAFRIGTAPLDSTPESSGILRIVNLGFVAMALFILLMNAQLIKAKNLNASLSLANVELAHQKRIIEEQNNEMKQIGASKNRFFSIIGHDIREPLNAIEGLMDLIARKEFKDLETKAMVKKMSKAARNTKLLINNLLEWSLTQSENVVFTKKRVQIDMLISDALVDVETQAEAKKISIKLENNDPIIYNGDPMMIRTIVRNILSNAIKFTQKFGKVNVNTFHSIDGLVIEISDNGAGMTDKEQEDLFELSNERTRKDADGLGTSGLGLVLAMDFARKHGGTIKVKSSVGEGSRFRLILPEDRPGFI